MTVMYVIFMVMTLNCSRFKLVPHPIFCRQIAVFNMLEATTFHFSLSRPVVSEVSKRVLRYKQLIKNKICILIVQFQIELYLFQFMLNF